MGTDVQSTIAPPLPDQSLPRSWTIKIDGPEEFAFKINLLEAGADARITGRLRSKEH
ncbi:MAG: hypothetical protein HQM09_22840 [Candidatus Riflebacteria bacterium]|nr:hypothetical protein [Candidatus Riflebacteria bacterium]